MARIILNDTNQTLFIVLEHSNSHEKTDNSRIRTFISPYQRLLASGAGGGIPFTEIFNLLIYSDCDMKTILGTHCVGNSNIRIYIDAYGNYASDDNLTGGGTPSNPGLCPSSALSSSAPSSSPSSQTGQTGQSQFHLSASMGLILLLILLTIFLAFKRQG